jgi:hypothetical protein
MVEGMRKASLLLVGGGGKAIVVGGRPQSLCVRVWLGIS